MGSRVRREEDDYEIHKYFAGEPLPKGADHSIFLAGPTPRGPEPKSWRGEALMLLQHGGNILKEGFPGTVFVPEPEEGPTGKWPSPFDQMVWEHRALEMASCIAFWVPRNMRNMPGLTTNVEFGLFAQSNKIVLGYPDHAEHISYLQFCAGRFGISIWDTLEETLYAATVMAFNG